VSSEAKERALKAHKAAVTDARTAAVPRVEVIVTIAACLEYN
jgi:hypothetical protein